DEPLGRPLLCHRASAHPALEEGRVPPHEVDRDERGSPDEDGQIEPPLPVADRPRRHEQEEAHHDRETGQGEPGAYAETCRHLRSLLESLETRRGSATRHLRSRGGSMRTFLPPLLLPPPIFPQA